MVDGASFEVLEAAGVDPARFAPFADVEPSAIILVKIFGTTSTGGPPLPRPLPFAPPRPPPASWVASTSLTFAGETLGVDSTFLVSSLALLALFFFLLLEPPSSLDGGAWAPVVDSASLPFFFPLSALLGRDDLAVCGTGPFPFPLPLPPPGPSLGCANGLFGITGDDDGLEGALAALSALEVVDFDEVRRVTGPLGTMGCAREKWASSSALATLDAWAALCLAALVLGPVVFAVIRASSSGVDSGLFESVRETCGLKEVEAMSKLRTRDNRCT